MNSSKNPDDRFLKRVNWTAVVSGLALFVLFCAGIYGSARSYVIHKAEQEIEGLILQHRGIHHYIQRNMHPELYSQKEKGMIPHAFYSPVMFSSSYMVRNMHNYMNEERIKKGQDPLYYKMAADNPRNPVNKADTSESRILRMFNRQPGLSEHREIITIDGQRYLQVALPFLPTTKPCLKCHGPREDAPPQLQDLYPGSGGFNEKIGVIRAIESIRVPMDKRLSLANIIMAASAVIALGFLVLTGFNRRLQSLVTDQTEQLRQSEERLSLAMLGANDGLWDWQYQEGTLVFDDRYYTMAGYAPHEFASEFREWEKRVHPEDLGPVLEKINAHVSGISDIYQADFRFKKKNGRYMWIRGRGRIFSRDDRGNPIRFVGTHSDISALKQSEAELMRLRNSLENVIDSMPSLIIGVDSDNRITQWNRHARKLSGTDRKAALGKPFDQVLPNLSHAVELVQKAMDTGQVCHRHRRPRQSDDSRIYEDITIYPLTAGGEEGAVIRIDDVSEKIRMEEMMIQSEKMLSVGGLAAGMAHEINNPLAGMMQSASVIKSRLTRPDMKANVAAARKLGISMQDIQAFIESREIPRMLEIIQRSGLRAAEIVDSMLSFARKSDAGQDMHDLGRLLDGILELAATDYDLKKEYDFKAIRIRRQFQDALPQVPCDSGKIQQVFLNILRNGAQAMQAAGTDSPGFVLRIHHEEEAGMVCVEIEDNGPGMDEKTRSKVFDPFFTTKPVGLGTGLGLSVSYFIVTENHNGRLDVVSEPGRGSTFMIRLPVGQRTGG